MNTDKNDSPTRKETHEIASQTPGTPAGEPKPSSGLHGSATPAWVSSGCPQDETKPSSGLHKIALLGLAVLGLTLSVAIFAGIRSRLQSEASLKVATDQAAIPTVDVIHPSDGASAEEIVLPGTTEAFTDTPIYARTNGYLKGWYFDIGARVRKGQIGCKFPRTVTKAALTTTCKLSSLKLPPSPMRGTKRISCGGAWMRASF